jgi:hypothetical protein
MKELSRREALHTLGIAGLLGIASCGGIKPPDTGGGTTSTAPKQPTTTTRPPTNPGWRTVFFDGFNGSSLDTAIWGYDHPLFNYGDQGGQTIDNVWLPKNVSVHDGALYLEAIKEDFDTRQISSTSTPRIAHYTSGGVTSHLPLWFPKQRIEFGVATELNFRPVPWTSAPQSGDDSEMDFEFFSVTDNCHIGQIWDYTPVMQEMREMPVHLMPDPRQLQRYACYRRPDGVNIWTINDVEVFRANNKMSQNGQRIRLQHNVGGRWDGGYKSETGSGGSLDPATHATMQVRWVVVTEPI